ncbi:MAG: type I-C CRISPR-associated protein Cas8c/Csd1, partial [Proteobacteria bacterium]|nr:type I-C CRISPR-associated protein Cas8c/Csd1 [Pseudomonadota bacterium]
MLLNRLAAYTQDRLERQPVMYISRPVKWLIDLDEDGKYLGITVLSDGTGTKNDRGKQMNLPHVMKSSGIKAKLLSDNAEYVLGLYDADKKRKRVHKCHRVFLELLDDCAKKTDGKSIQAILDFYKTGGMPQDEIERNSIQGKDEVTFRVAGAYPFELPVVQDYWAARSAIDVSSRGQCVVCGRNGPVLQRIPHKIKRIPDGQTAGNSIISANADPFESYGLENSLIAPTCPRCAEDFSRALNSLLADKNSHIRVGPSVYVFWTKEESDFTIGNYFQQPDPNEVRELIRSVRTAQSGNLGLDESDFYAVSLSASGARVVVRDYLETTIFQVKKKLARWFEMQSIVNTNGHEGDPIAIYPLAASLYRDANKEMAPHILPALVGSALHGNPLPEWLLALAVRRNIADRQVTRPRAALIKMVLFSMNIQKILEDNDMVERGKNSENQAYQLGRLMAVLESIQKEALKGIKSTITDRFYGSASTAPASVFGRLLSGSKAHLSKIRKDKKWLYDILEERLEEVCGAITSFPAILKLKDQG